MVSFHVQVDELVKEIVFVDSFHFSSIVRKVMCFLDRSRMHSRAYMLLEKEWFKLQKEELPWVSWVDHLFKL